MDEQELREAVAELVDDWYTGEVASRVSVAPDARDDLKERIAGFVRGEQAEVERLRDQLRASVKLTAIREKQLSEELALAAKDKAKIKRLRTACRQAEVFLFRLVRDSGNSDDDPARPVLAVMRKALRETGQ